MRLHSAGSIAVLLLACMAAAQDGRQTVSRGDARGAVVETIVTDKKGNYLRDLTAKEFRVWEDGKEQPVTGVSLQSGAASREPEDRNYMLVLFDNTSADNEHQTQIKAALAEFAGDRREQVWLGVAVYNGGLSIAQDFTTDADRVRKAVEDVPAATARLSTNPTAAQDVLMARTFLIRLAALGKGLAPVPGRKAVVLLIGGLYVPDSALPEFKAAIAACNQANAAIYPVELRGLTSRATERTPASSAPGGMSSIDTGINTREALNALAADTGGFVIRNSNDFAAGLRSIAAERRESYTVTYTSRQNDKTGCHSLRVKVSRGGAQVRARNSYCVVGQ